MLNNDLVRIIVQRTRLWAAGLARGAVAMAVLAAPAVGQKPPKPLPVIRGLIQDDAGKPLSGGQVEILGLNRVANASGSGAYRIDAIRPGKYWVVVRRIGYAPLRVAMNFNQGDDREIDFQLEPLPYNLPEVKVTAEDKAWLQKYQDFVWRSKTSFGRFITRDDIDRVKPNSLVDLVRRFSPFLNVSEFGASPGWWGHGNLGWSSRGGCTPAVSLNGNRPILGWNLNDFRPEEVEAVEVYRSARQLPVEFWNWGGGCGLVVVWTDS